jgi:hypothetical protein
MLFCCNAHDIRGDPETPIVGKDGNVSHAEAIVEQPESDDAITDVVLVLKSSQSGILSVLAPGISYQPYGYSGWELIYLSVINKNVNAWAC